MLFLEKLQTSGSVTQAAVAGEITRRAWYDLRDRDPDVFNLWDDAELTCMDRVETEAEVIREKMEHALELNTPIVVDVAWGKNWSEGK